LCYAWYTSYERHEGFGAGTLRLRTLEPVKSRKMLGFDAC
jgi:hypothetical protein